MMQEEEKKYSQGEEIVNTTTHAAGALFAIYAIVMLAYKSKTPIESCTTAIYGAMLFLLFNFSAWYHAVSNSKAKNILRKFDHSAIYLLIAGTYTPILMIVLKFPYSVISLAMIWYLAITGIIFSCITLKYNKLSTGIYVLLGWLSAFLFYILWIENYKLSLLFLFLGGVMYTIGSIFYLSRKKYFHGIWHIFVLLAAILHYCGIYYLI